VSAKLGLSSERRTGIAIVYIPNAIEEFCSMRGVD
jgi:hypothetical protein